MKMHMCSIVFISLSLFLSSESARILGLFPTFSKSHLIIHRSIMETLIDRGHDVTIVTTLPLDEPKKNFRHILLDVPPPPKDFMTGMIKKGKGPLSIFDSAFRAMDFSIQYSNISLNDPQMQKLMGEESFDLVVFGYLFNNFLAGVAGHFKCPLVVSFVQRPIAMLNHMVGNPAELSYVPNMMIGNAQPMGFFDRVKTFLIGIVADEGVSSILEYKMRKYYETNFLADKYPSYQEMQKNVSLVLCNSHFSNGIIRPNVPAVVEIGGIQVKPKADPLPAVSMFECDLDL